MSGALEGFRVVVTRPDGGPLVDELRAAGAAVVIAPLIVIADPESFAPLDAALNRLAAGDYIWVLFTSRNSVWKVMMRLEPLGGTEAIRAEVAAVGPSTAELLLWHGAPVKVVPEQFTGAAAAAAIGSGTGKVLLPRVEGGPQEIVEVLVALGWQVDEVPAYRNLPVGPGAPGVNEIVAGAYDIMTLASPSAARSLVSLASVFDLGLAQDNDSPKKVACIGPSTAAAARAAGLRVDVVADEHTSAGLVKAIVDHVQGMAR